MHFNRRAAWLTSALVLFIGGLACQTTDRVLNIAQANTATPTRTRTPRPTFTPLPPPTDTLAPTDTPIPTASRTPTRRPPTPKPPTPKPPPPTVPPAPQPTVFAYQYHATPPTCEHAGQSYIKGTVYNDKNDPSSGTPGIRVALGGAGGDQFVPPNTTDGQGDYTYILTQVGEPPKVGTFYVWIVDSSNNRISEMGGPLNLNGKSETAPDTCWAGHVYFTKN